MILFQDKTWEKHETVQAAPGGVIAAQATVSMTDFTYEVMKVHQRCQVKIKVVNAKSWITCS